MGINIRSAEQRGGEGGGCKPHIQTLWNSSSHVIIEGFAVSSDLIEGL